MSSQWSPHNQKVAVVELKLCRFIGEHNLPFALLDHLPGFIANVCPDSVIAKNIKMCKD